MIGRLFWRFADRVHEYRRRAARRRRNSRAAARHRARARLFTTAGPLVRWSLCEECGRRLIGARPGKIVTPEPIDDGVVTMYFDSQIVDWIAEPCGHRNRRVEFRVT